MKSKTTTKKSARPSTKRKGKQPPVKGRGAAVKKATNAPVAATAAAGPLVNENLRKVLVNIRELQWSGNVRTAEDQYGIGQEVQKVENDPKKYGLKPDQTPVKFLAKELGCEKDTLYNAARVVRLWKRPVFDRWLKRLGANGYQLSFAHFTEVARIPDAKGREEMLQRALDKRMTAKAVRSAVPNSKPKLQRPLEKLIERSERALADWQSIDGVIGDSSADPLKLDKAAELQHRLSELCLENSKALHRWIDGLATATVSNGAVVAGGTPVSLRPKILGASNSPTPPAKLLSATNSGPLSDAPEPDTKGPSGGPRLETLNSVSEVGALSAGVE